VSAALAAAGYDEAVTVEESTNHDTVLFRLATVDAIVDAYATVAP
jgi:hypothetical protein